MFWKKYTWHLLASTEEKLPIQANGIGIVEVLGKKICITKNKGKWMAFLDACPHAGVPLSEGYVDSVGNIVCTTHNMKFALKNGRSSFPEGYCMKMFPVEIRKDGVYIGLEEKA